MNAVVLKELDMGDDRIARTRVMRARNAAIRDEVEVNQLCGVYELVHLKALSLDIAAERLKLPLEEVKSQDEMIREIIDRNIAEQPPVQ
jgi:hypothetical protein